MLAAYFSAGLTGEAVRIDNLFVHMNSKSKWKSVCVCISDLLFITDKQAELVQNLCWSPAEYTNNVHDVLDPTLG